MSPNHMAYVSTRGGIRPIGFREAVMMGLADDGGLLLPAVIPDLSRELDAWRKLSYPDLAAAVMQPFVGADVPDATFRDLVNRAYATFSHPEITPLVPVGPVHILELFHGPTLAFKDVALQVLGNLFEHILRQTGQALNIVGATSGDTGSAAIHGVRGRAGIHIFIMHPHQRVSPVQERQMTTVLDANVHNIAVEGTFDDGQRVLKELFSDLEFKTRYRLGAVNSVNWARVLAQVVYYFYAAFRVQERTGAALAQIAVPTGNFGDIFAGYVALRLGAPIRRLILATNENDILVRFFDTGIYELGLVHETLSPSMDIQVASNFERYLFYRLNQDPERVQNAMAQFRRDGRLAIQGTDPLFAAGRGNRQETLAAIRGYYQRYGYLLDPHTAVGVAVAERFLDPACPTVCLATAHPAKFGGAIREALGQDVARHPAIDALAGLPTRCVVLPATRQDVGDFIAGTLAAA